MCISIYTNCSDYIDDVSARQAVASVLRFLTRMGIIKYYNHSGFIAHVLDEDELMAVKTNTAGLYRRLKSPSDPVYRGDIIGEVIDPYEGEVINQVISPTEGIIFLHIQHLRLWRTMLSTELSADFMSNK